ncbi:pyridoxal-phosphate dependent enzyme [Xanthovirga aplysinae]|uniref:pyridoxal-phosphate dependent enzyme n=1 Tax=Xanthovirga aplysinae TaxID=2529853 RepID=UPI0012BB7848|nr:pyridoxal-phosphate dependent enzyme [Xanthovirga aplysinae]MTI31712.1 pyridoxal-phosphate dependent enzyme [Xanthovirga aplysinae]
MAIPTLEDIENTHQNISPFIHKTPVLTSKSINAITGADIFFKCENFQKVGAFKFRGALNALQGLNREELEKGVATHSSGNHAQALALAAKNMGVKAYIVMPNSAPKVKKNAVLGYGAEVILCEPTLKAREETLQIVVEKTGAIFIPPYNDYNIICGQATAAKEFLEEIKDLDVVITPVGGGGLLSGTSLTVKYLAPHIQVIGGEPEGANDAFQSFSSKIFQPVVNPNTVADGLKTSLGDKTFEIILNYVDDILTVDDTLTIQAMRLVWERMKIIIEPSSAVPLAVILKYPEKFKGKRTGLIVSGGNVDLKDVLPMIS